MDQFRYKVEYKTAESRPEVENLLRRYCSGEWNVHEIPRRRSKQERTDFLLSFERETDINALFARASNAH